MSMSIWGYPYPTKPKVETKEEPTPAVAPTVGGTVLYSPPSGENGAAGTPVAELYPSAVPPKNDAVPNGNEQGSAGSVMPPQASAGSGVLYTPGSQAPTNGDPLSYAQWLYGKSVYDAEQMRLRADKQAETDRQRAIVDANSAYQQGRATYGANAEAVAGMGLSGSGYGEYLTGKAYATQRGEVQNANVTAQARKDKALYEENSAKTQAGQTFVTYLDGITDGIYNTYLNGIKDGTLTLEQIKADSAYKRLSPTLQGSLEYEAWKAKPAKENSDIQSAYDNLISLAAMGTNFSLIFENEDYKKLNGTLQESIKNEFIDTVISQKTFATRTAFEKAMKENGLTNEKDIEEAVKRWQENEYNAMLSGSALLSGKEVYEAYESGVISKEQMNSYVKKKYGAQSAVYPSGSLSGVGAGSNIDEVTVTDKDGKQYRCVVNKLPKGVTSDELDAFFGGTPKAKSRGEADWVVYKGEVYIYGKNGWKILKPYSIFSKNDLVNGLLKG